MRTIIAGSRTITDLKIVEDAIKESGFDIDTVICGGAKGVDKLGELWARRNMLFIEYFYPDWDLYGKAAGPIRNKQMAENADALIAIWDGVSKGTKSMIDLATKQGLEIFVVNVNTK